MSFEILRKSKIGRRYLSFFYTFICENFFPPTQPTKTIIEKSESFFSENETRIEVIRNFLSDEKSRKTFDAVIKARRTGNLSLLRPIKESSPEYFPFDIFSIIDDEVFVDCGAFNGDTIRTLFKLAKKSDVNIKKVFALEPAELSFKDLTEYADKINKHKDIITCINKGAYNSETKLFLSSNTGVGAHVEESESKGNTFSILTTTIDTFCINENISFIKMDIEGAELPALQGAKNTILRCKPKLAICLYHSDDDILRLAEYIHQLIPEYRIYIRHYSRSIHETILYAII